MLFRSRHDRVEVRVRWAVLAGVLGAGALSVKQSFGEIVVLTLVVTAYLLWRSTLRRALTFAGAVLAGAVLLIGALCFVSFLAEGAMLDWSAVFLVATHGVSPSVAGLGYAAFAAAMTAARFGGDARGGEIGRAHV